MCVGCPYSPQSLTCVSSWGFVRLPRYKAINEPCPNGPTHSVVQNVNVLPRNSNYLGYISLIQATADYDFSAVACNSSKSISITRFDSNELISPASAA
ncbi:hypothetical protein DMB83_001590 [Pectobacterium aquaticum]|nr:hypothetical protein DMB83_001590 [Pectobacterium aquaticum]RRO06731.1 hypothetical protein DMB81_011940 [Pectobacterium aquaticum]TAJ04464.1 hypothetical protein EG334_08935 [Pectobacterium versatile]